MLGEKVGSDLPERKSHQNRCEHQEDAIIPPVLFRHNQLNSQHILESSQTCCEKRHQDQEDEKVLFQWTHLYSV